MRKERRYTNLQLRRLGFPQESRYCIVKRLPIGNFYIGRKKDPEWDFLNLLSEFVSSKHCRIESMENGQIFLYDSSTNGVFVNNESYTNTSVELREGDRLGIGYPVTEENAHNKAYYGFVLERVKIKQELKQEITYDEYEGELLIDEATVPETIPSEAISPEIASPTEENSPEVIADASDIPDDFQLKKEKISYESDGELSNYTDDEQEVIYIDSDDDDHGSFDYLKQFSQNIVFHDIKMYNETQMVLSDLLGSEKTNGTLPAESCPETHGQPHESPKNIITDPVPSTSKSTEILPPETLVAPKPKTVCVEVNTDPIELLRDIDLDECLNRLIEIHGFDKCIDKLKSIGKKLEKHNNRRESTDRKKEESNRKKSTEKKRNKKHSSKEKEQKNTEKKENERAALQKEKKIENRRSSHHPTSEHELKTHEKETSRKESQTIASKTSKIENRRSSHYPTNEHETKTNEKETSRKESQTIALKTSKIDNRRNSAVILEREQSQQPTLDVSAESVDCDNGGLIARTSHSITERRNSNCISPSFSTMKRKVDDEITGNQTKNRNKFEHEPKKFRSIPDPKPIEECFSASQLPPPLEVVPEPKVPEFKNKLFNKNPHRVAHKPEEKPKKIDTTNKEKKDDVSKKRNEKPGFKIPKRRKSTTTNNILNLLDSIDDSGKNSIDNAVRQEVILPVANHSPPSDTTRHSPDTQAPLAPVTTAPSTPPVNVGDILNRAKNLGFLAPQASTSTSKAQNCAFVKPLPPKENREIYNQNRFVIPSSSIMGNVKNQDPRIQKGIVPAFQKISSVPYNCWYILEDILSWDVNWIGEDNPPIVKDIDKLSSVTSTFLSYGHYVNTFVPLLKLELFKGIVDALPVRKNTCVKANIVSQFNHTTVIRDFTAESLITVKCEISPEDHKKNREYFRYGTIAIVYSNSEDKCFGLINRVPEFNEKKSSVVDILMPRSFPAQYIREIEVCLLLYIKVELETFLSLGNLKHSPLLELILDPNKMEFERKASNWENMGMQKLNACQFEALCLISEKVLYDNDNPHIFLIEGPPGTGKSRLITNLILHFHRNPSLGRKNFRILLCAPSNYTVDVLTTRLIEFRFRLIGEERRCFKLVRFGENIGDELCKLYSVSNLMKIDILKEFTRVASTFPNDSKEQKQRISLYNDRTELENNLRKFPTSNPTIRNKINSDIINLEQKMYMKRNSKEFSNFKQGVKKNLLNNAKIVCSTIAACPSLANNSDKKFDILIVDEATQAIETTCLMAMNSGIKHVVLVGDTKQLPAMVRSQRAKELGLGQSFFARARSTSTNYLSLNRQYRMHPEILRFCNEVFYHNSIENKTIVDKSYLLKPYLVFELDTEQNLTQNPHHYNTNEMDFVIDLVSTIKEIVPKELSIGIITPYAKQKNLIKEKLGSDKRVTVSTIDGIQGQERDIIVFSCVRTNGVGFLALPERLNVALTRARKSLFICGNFISLRTVEVWDRLIEDAKARGVYIDTGTNTSNLREYLLNV